MPPSDNITDAWFRPVWEDAEKAPSLPRPPARPGPPAEVAGLDLAALLDPLCTGQAALSRLDAKAEAATTVIRQGLIARLAFREAAGWLASVGAWVHPRDLALRAAHLIGRSELPNTAGRHWEAMDPASRLQAEGQVQTALVLARLLQQLSRHSRLFADPDTAAVALEPLAGVCDPARLAGWRSRWTAKPATAALPALLTAALAAADWLESGITDLPSPIAALAMSAGLLAENGALPVIPLPFWGAAPVLAISEPGVLPRLRGEALTRLYPAGPPNWPGVFLSLLAEASRAGLQELDRLQTAAAEGAKLTAGLDRRSRLPGALESMLREPAVTPKGLARDLRITPPAALRLLAQLSKAGIARETTGRRSFRAFAV